MKITYLGIELHQAEQIDLPNILRWRNQAQVRQFMQHQSIISAARHQDWFDHLQKQTNFYFILKKDGQLGGLLQLSENDYYRRRAEAGILIGEAFFRGSYLPWLGSYTLLRFAFDLLHLDQLNATVCKQNITAKEYNQSFGFRKTNAHDNGFCTYRLTRVAWRAATRPYKQLLPATQRPENEHRLLYQKDRRPSSTSAYSTEKGLCYAYLFRSNCICRRRKRLGFMVHFKYLTQGERCA